jgi:DNA-binding protein H-NS
MPRATLTQLRQQIARLESQAKKLESADAEKRRKAVSEVLALMKKLGVEVSDLDGAVRKAGRPATKKKAPGAGTRPPGPVKYRIAETGDAWTGRGRTPTWLAALEAQGRKREEFLVAK